MQHNINKQIQNLTESDESLIISIEYMLDVVSKSKYIFKSSGNRKKRRLINFLFSNLELDGINLCYSLKKPFDKLLDIEEISKWRELCNEFRTTYRDDILKIYPFIQENIYQEMRC